MKNARSLTALVAIILLSLAATPTTATETVSPGAVDWMAQVNNVCPTFSWEEAEATKLFEIVAYAIHENDDPTTAGLTAETEVLYSRVPGGATSWTPSADQCFAPGGRYVWFVRSVSELSGDEVMAAGKWSAGRYFEVPAAPSPEEMQRALDVLKRWDAANGGGDESPSLAGMRSGGASPTLRRSGWGGTISDEGSAATKSVPTASAAIRGEHPDPSGEAYGVVGISGSGGGAGIAAANLGGGPDLVLDGSADGNTDTVFSEGGLDRASPSAEIFRVRNTGGGSMTLSVQGILSATDLDCFGCVNALTIAEGAVNTDAIYDRAVDNSKLEDGSVTTTKILDGQVRDVDLGPDAVTEEKLADGAVTITKIADVSVSKDKLRDNAVVSSKILDGSIEGVDLAIGSVGSTQILNQSVTGNDLADSSVATRHIENGTIKAADVDLDSGIYVSKSQLDERNDSCSTGGDVCEASAVCHDANDLPLTGWCHATIGQGCDVWDFKAVDWDNPSLAAQYVCRFHSEWINSCTGTASILCISVPGP